MNRNKTDFRHINEDGEVSRVTEENNEFFIGNSNDRAEGKMSHYKNVNKLQDEHNEMSDWADQEDDH